MRSCCAVCTQAKEASTREHNYDLSEAALAFLYYFSLQLFAHAHRQVPARVTRRLPDALLGLSVSRPLFLPSLQMRGPRDGGAASVALGGSVGNLRLLFLFSPAGECYFSRPTFFRGRKCRAKTLLENMIYRNPTDSRRPIWGLSFCFG